MNQSPSTSRRLFLASTAATASAAYIASPAFGAPNVKVHERRVISKLPQFYCGWPTLTRRSNGELLVVWSGGREEHVCPFGRVELIRSRDDGKTWSWPRTLLDGPIDDRDAGIVETSKGTLLATTFTSLAYQPALDRAKQAAASGSPSWSADRLERWLSVHERISSEQRQKELGQWMIRSTDGGVTWSQRYPSIVNSPHGPIQLASGDLLYAGKELWTSEDHRIGACISRDDGQSWQWHGMIPTRPGDDPLRYHELHAVETAGGRIIAHIRNHNPVDSGHTLQSHSDDGGKTWSTPRSIGVWGLPSFLTRLTDDRLLMSYGHRRAPLGNQARVSSDNGESWSDPIAISDDGTSGDLGYPSTVELADGSLLTVWYEKIAGSPKAVLRQCHWSLKS